MSMEAEVGGGLELGNFSLKTLIEIGATLDSIHKHLKGIRKIEEAYEFGAVQVILRGTATSDSASDTIEIGLGGPSYGRVWQVHRLTVGGALWTTTAAGQALVVVSPSKTLTPALSDIADQAGSLPSVAYYGAGQLVVRHPNHLRVVFLTPTATTQYAVGGQAIDLPDRHLRLETES